MGLGTEILLNQLKGAHEAFLGTMDGVTNDVAQYQPAGTANPIAGTFAHLTFSEDMFIHLFLKKDQPLFETAFKEKTGASELHPMEWEVAYPKWLREVKVDMPAFMEYTKAVFENSEKYVESLSDEDLERDADMSSFGMGTRKFYDVISNMITGHVSGIMGEISVLKGIQGLKGYPF